MLHVSKVIQIFNDNLWEFELDGLMNEMATKSLIIQHCGKGDLFLKLSFELVVIKTKE